MYLVILGTAVLVGLFLALAFRRRTRVEVRPVRNLSAPATSRAFHEAHKTEILGTSVESEDGLALGLRQNLLLKALGNTSVVERLVAFERSKNPTGKDVQWLDAAIRRWERDNNCR
jgi:hypothetical protein